MAQTDPNTCGRIYEIFSDLPSNVIPTVDHGLHLQTIQEKGAFFDRMSQQALDYLHGRCLSNGGVITCFASGNQDMSEQIWVRDNMIALNLLEDHLERDASNADQTFSEIKNTLNLWKRFQKTPVPVRENSQIVREQPSGNAKMAPNPGEPIATKDGQPVFKDWGVPQDDAVGWRIIAVEKYLNLLKKYGKDESTVQAEFPDFWKTDAEYLLQKSLQAQWDSNQNLQAIRFPKSKDLWEETGNLPDIALFNTNALIIRGLNSAARMAEDRNDLGATRAYEKTAKLLRSRTLKEFWDPKRNLFGAHLPEASTKPRQVDLGVLLGILDTEGDLVSLTSDQVFSTVYENEKAFRDAFPINQNRNLKESLYIGRYPEDKYDGFGVSLGNPWVIGNFRWSDYYYRISKGLRTQSITISNLNSGFFNEGLGLNLSLGKTISPGSAEHSAILTAAERKADLFVQVVLESLQNANFQKPTSLDQQKNIFYSLGEQLHRNDTKNTGSQGLTWNAAAALQMIQSWKELQATKGQSLSVH